MEKADIESIPIKKTFDLNDEKDAYDAAEEMVRIGFCEILLMIFFCPIEFFRRFDLRYYFSIKFFSCDRI